MQRRSRQPALHLFLKPPSPASSAANMASFELVFDLFRPILPFISTFVSALTDLPSCSIAATDGRAQRLVTARTLVTWQHPCFSAEIRIFLPVWSDALIPVFLIDSTIPCYLASCQCS